MARFNFGTFVHILAATGAQEAQYLAEEQRRQLDKHFHFLTFLFPISRSSRRPGLWRQDILQVDKDIAESNFRERQEKVNF